MFALWVDWGIGGVSCRLPFPCRGDGFFPPHPSPPLSGVMLTFPTSVAVPSWLVYLRLLSSQ